MDNLKFKPTELRDFPALVTKEFFGKQDPDGFVFAPAFIESLEQRFASEVEQVLLYNGGASRNSLGIIYFEDLTICGVEFTGDSNLTGWFEAMSSKFGGSSTHRVTSSGVSGSSFSQWEELVRAPMIWAQRKAPKSHFKEELAQEKRAYFDLDTRRPDTRDAAGFSAAFQALLDARAAQATSPNLAALDALESAVGAPLPLDFKALYAATGAIKSLFYGFDLLSAEACATEHANWMAVYEDWTLDDLQSCSSAEAGIYPVYYMPRWIPFVDRVCGNYLAIDLGPTEEGTYGQIIAAGRDTDHKRLLGQSLTEFVVKAATYDGAQSHALYDVFGELEPS